MPIYRVIALEKFIVRTVYMIEGENRAEAEERCRSGSVAYVEHFIEEGQEEWLQTLAIEDLDESQATDANSRWRCTYLIHSDIAATPAAGACEVVACDLNAAKDAARKWVYDHDPRCDERLHPVVEITSVEPTIRQ